MERQLSIDLVKNIKECKSIDDFDMSKVDLIRGETPADIKEKCLKLCQEYIGDVWNKVTVDDIQIKRLSGGLTNQLYYCAIEETVTVQTVDLVAPKEVAVRLYGSKHFNIDSENEGNERLNDVIIALMVSKNKLGPKIYGIFEEGQIQHYYKHRQFRYDEQNNQKLADNLFRILARVHAMDVPIKRTNYGLTDIFDEVYESAYQRFPIDKLINDLKLETYLKYDLKKEVLWLKKAVDEMDSPRVFTHVDFRGSNIMVSEPNDQIILCDFEYSNYSHRGLDFGTILVEWNRPLEEMFRSVNFLDKYPDDIQLRKLLRPYIEESELILGKSFSENPLNSMEVLIREVKLFSMVSVMFIVLFCLKNDETLETSIPLNKDVTMQMGELNYKNYHAMKELFRKQGVFK